MATVPAAYPFIKVLIDTSQLTPIAQRAPGVIAIVGETGGAGTAPVNVPLVVDSLAQAATLFATVSATGVVTSTKLYAAIKVALLQNPQPSKIYAVKVDGTSYDAALGALEAADDVTFVSLAGISTVATLAKLKDHAEQMSAAGAKRIAVMMIDPSVAKSATYATTVNAGLTGTPNLKSSVSRVIMVAARGAVDDDGDPADTATAAMAAVAGYQPQTSIVLKQLRGITIPVEKQYSPSEIKALSEFNIVPIIQPALIVGGGFYFAEGRTFTSDASLLYVDTVRTLDDIDFRLKAGLIGAIGDARITKPGLIGLKTRIDGVLGPVKRTEMIDDYTIDIPVLTILSRPESAWTATERALVTTARSTRTLDVVLSVELGPQVHVLIIQLQPHY
ncbi:MAG: hypothetical protein ABI437_22970 [Kofleriaceae bacterium]